MFLVFMNLVGWTLHAQNGYTNVYFHLYYPLVVYEPEFYLVSYFSIGTELQYSQLHYYFCITLSRSTIFIENYILELQLLLRLWVLIEKGHISLYCQSSYSRNCSWYIEMDGIFSRNDSPSKAMKNTFYLI